MGVTRLEPVLLPSQDMGNQVIIGLYGITE